ncbi:arsenate reductase family protein [Ligilactobacillus sp. Marseille-Q7487]|jgi:arsenate reductase|uniref:arsenate reductase family protein n=1 Tax=Ligilactobacillus sp. Marseille-Q7487 TaxID=3022128 RepID=UPI0015B6AB12|nr:arsenate reductase family protein [Ligilactobacillus sp. Marseille-Q7487]
MKKFYCYSRCSTCRKAQKWLEEHQVEFESQDIVKNPPSQEELLAWLTASDKPLRYFFNTSGQRYRELGLKDKLADMTLQEASALLASDGKLIKRPLMVEDKQVTCGFKEDVYQELWLD